MTITNKASVTLEILGDCLPPNETREYSKRGSFDICSEIGCCGITTTKDNKRRVTNYGKLVAIEGGEKDNNGLRRIIVYSID